MQAQKNYTDHYNTSIWKDKTAFLLPSMCKYRLNYQQQTITKLQDNRPGSGTVLFLPHIPDKKDDTAKMIVLVSIK